MHRLINVSANSQFYSSEHNLELQIVQRRLPTHFTLILMGKIMSQGLRKANLDPGCIMKKGIPEPLPFFFPLWSPPFLSVKCPPHQFGYTNQHRAPNWAMCHFFRLGKEQPVPQSQAGNVPSSSGRRP